MTMLFGYFEIKYRGICAVDVKVAACNLGIVFRKANCSGVIFLCKVEV